MPSAITAEVIIILVLENTDARLAFSEIVEWLNEQLRDPELLSVRGHARKYMWISLN